jgi:hypothetical protein
MGRRVGAFYLLEESCFTGVVEAEEEDRVLWGLLDGGSECILNGSISDAGRR